MVNQIRLPPELENFMLEMEVSRRQALIARCKADPVGNKLTLQFDGPMRWRYYDGGTRHGRSYRFCYTTTRNAAGYFLFFREVRSFRKGTGKRDQFSASRKKSICAARALARFKRHRGDK